MDIGIRTNIQDLGLPGKYNQPPLDLWTTAMRVIAQLTFSCALPQGAKVVLDVRIQNAHLVMDT
jgi:hypothetical protein